MKQLFLATVAILASLLLFEIGARAYFSSKVGPSVWVYGTPFDRKYGESIDSTRGSMSRKEWRTKRSVIEHKNRSGNYSKYFPNQKRVDFDIETGESFDVTINSNGFRGEDFTVQKKARIIRILTLGASSTFGYYDRDDETYPVYMEQILNERWPGDRAVEVINLGIPHLVAEKILNLFLAEGIQLDPDVVTIYAGSNDAGKIDWIFGSVEDPPDQNNSAGPRGYFIAVDLIKSLLDRNALKRYELADLREKTAAISGPFLDSVDRIFQECKRRDILFIVANQQKNSRTELRSDLNYVTYQAEAEMILSKLLRTGALTKDQVSFLVHSFLVKDLESWAMENQVPFVDAIAALNKDRDEMVSYVHLSPKANRLLAEAFARKILSFSEELD